MDEIDVFDGFAVDDEPYPPVAVGPRTADDRPQCVLCLTELPEDAPCYVVRTGRLVPVADGVASDGELHPVLPNVVEMGIEYWLCRSCTPDAVPRDRAVAAHRRIAERALQRLGGATGGTL